jgi:hypothetical protein
MGASSEQEGSRHPYFSLDLGSDVDGYPSEEKPTLPAKFHNGEEMAIDGLTVIRAPKP